MSSCGVNEKDGKIRECEDDDVWWNDDECLHHHVCVLAKIEQKKTIVQSRIKHSLANLIK